MGLTRVCGLYDCNGRLAAWRTYVYFFMARDGAGPMYVKVGRSDNPITRLETVQTGCPLPIVKAGMVKCLTIEQSRKIERDLHTMLSGWHSSGEWFRLNWEEGDDKSALMGMMNVVFAGIPDWKFEEIDLGAAAAAVRALVRDRQRRSRIRRRAPQQ